MPAEPGILFVTRKWAPATGGMETYCMRLTEKLAEIEPVQVIALKGKANGMPPGLAALLTFPLRVFRAFLRRRTAPRVLHLGDMAIWPLALPALWWRGTRIVLAAHGTDVSYPRRGGWRGRLYGRYLRAGARLLRQPQVIANSTATELACRESGWNNVTIVRLATDMKPATVPAEHDRTILFAGRLVRRKGLGWFVNNVLPLLDDTFRVQVAGTGWDADERTALDHPRVTHLGSLPPEELAGAFAAAMCVIVPNIDLPNGEFEGFGLVACEAASAGGLVLAARSGGLQSAVIEGETGFLLPSGDAQEWREKILEVASWSQADRASFVRRSTAVAQREFAWERVARETRAAYGT